MVQLSKSKTVSWTHHARAKMNFYRLSEARVLRVLNSPKRIEEGVAPKTVAMMQPASVKTMAGKPASFRIIRKEAVLSDVPYQYAERSRRILSNPSSISKTGVKNSGSLGVESLGRTFKETWTQEIWVMAEDSRKGRTIISAWRYPGKTKPRSEISLAKMREEYQSFLAKRVENEH